MNASMARPLGRDEPTAQVEAPATKPLSKSTQRSNAKDARRQNCAAGQANNKMTKTLSASCADVKGLRPTL